MNNRPCLYFVEGDCEKQLINALKLSPGKVIPGKVKVFNVTQKYIPKSQLLTIKQGSIVAFAFDVDLDNTKILSENIKLVGRYCSRIQMIYLPQVPNFEGELVRCTDVSSVIEITNSRSLHNFKTDFCNMKTDACRHALDRHHLNVQKLWTFEVPQAYSFIKQNGELVKRD